MHLTTSVCRCVQGERYLLSASCLRGSSVARAEGFQVAAVWVGGGEGGALLREILLMNRDCPVRLTTDSRKEMLQE